MPASRKVTRQAILKTAFRIVQDSGMDALNMRTLAQQCGCSTQPIYLLFGNAEGLKSEVTKMITENFNSFLENEISKGQFPEYKAIGMGYIKYAVQETQLFKYLFMRSRKEELHFEKDSFDNTKLIIMKNYGLYKDEATTLHTEMWIFVHGIATMFATGYLDWDFDTVSKMVTDAYLGLLSRIKHGDA